MFGGGAGTIVDMIIRHRNNMNMLRKKRLFKKGWSYFKSEYIKASHGKILLEKVSKEELALIRAKVLAQRKKEVIKTLVLLVIIVPIVLYIGFSFINSFTKTKSIGYHEEQVIKPTKNDYNFFIEDGDYWLKQNNWHNAIYQYKKALEVIPDDFDANYRLALAYVYNCQHKKLNCEEAEHLLNKLIRSKNKNMELYDLRARYYIIIGDTQMANYDFENIDRITQ